MCEDHVALKWKREKTSGVWVFERVLFLLFSAFLEPAHVLPVCMINLFSLIIYVIQNVIYVNVNFELWPKRRIVNLPSQTLSEYTLLHSLVWSTHKSLQTGADVHTLAFFPLLSHRSWRLQIRQKSRWSLHMWKQHKEMSSLLWITKKSCNVDYSPFKLEDIGRVY